MKKQLLLLMVSLGFRSMLALAQDGKSGGSGKG